MSLSRLHTSLLLFPSYALAMTSYFSLVVMQVFLLDASYAMTMPPGHTPSLRR